MNFNSVFEELNKLYEEKAEETPVENLDEKFKGHIENVDELKAELLKKLPESGVWDGLGKKDELHATMPGDKGINVITSIVNSVLANSILDADVKVTKAMGTKENWVAIAITGIKEDSSAMQLFDSYKETGEKEDLTEAAEDEETEIVDDEVTVEEEPIEEPVEEVEARQLILECSKCGAIVIKDEADMVVNEESDLVNVEDECEYCEEKEGYKIIGVVAPYETAEVEVAEEAPVEESLAENYEDDLGRKAWSKNAMSYFDQAAKELGLENFTMKAVSRDVNKAGSKDKAIIVATKDGKKLEAEDTVEDTNPRNVAEAKEILEIVFGI